jgi:hypothetical protein
MTGGFDMARWLGPFRRLPVVAVVAVVVGGLAATVPASGGTTVASWGFSTPVVLPGSSGLGEPSLAVAPDGKTLWSCAPSGLGALTSSPVWRSTNAGLTWSQPIYPYAPEEATGGGDCELMVDKRGTVYFGDLWLGNDSLYISADQGKTWTWSPLSHNVGSDREWLTYSTAQDTLYGVYDDLFHGIDVIQAPLNTPAGANAALMAPFERTLFAEWDDCPGALAGPCQQKPSQVPDQLPDGTPLLAGTISPARPSVAPDGTVYMFASYQVAGKGIAVAVGTPDPTTGIAGWTYHYVTGAGHGVFGDTHYNAQASAVDAAGNAYIAWVEQKSPASGFQVYLSYSTDKGASWTGPIEVSRGVSKTAVFPVLAAGAAGRIAVGWYGSSAKGNPNTLKDNWTVYAAQSINVLSPHRSFTATVVQPNFHTGNICTGGTNCTGKGRALLDFFSMQIDSRGATLIVYTRDQGSGTQLAFSRQTSGCSLRQPGVALTPTATRRSSAGKC